MLVTQFSSSVCLCYYCHYPSNNFFIVVLFSCNGSVCVCTLCCLEWRLMCGVLVCGCVGGGWGWEWEWGCCWLGHLERTEDSRLPKCLLVCNLWVVRGEDWMTCWGARMYVCWSDEGWPGQPHRTKAWQFSTAQAQVHILWQVLSKAGDHYAALFNEPWRTLTDVLSHLACIAQLSECRGGGWGGVCVWVGVLVWVWVWGVWVCIYMCIFLIPASLNPLHTKGNVSECSCHNWGIQCLCMTVCWAWGHYHYQLGRFPDTVHVCVCACVCSCYGNFTCMCAPMESEWCIML